MGPPANGLTPAREEEAARRMPLGQLGGFCILCLLPFALSWALTKELSSLVLSDDSFSQILVIPLVSGFLIFEGRKRIFASVSPASALGLALIVPGLLLLLAAQFNVWELRETNRAALFVFCVTLIWLGAFALFFGARAFQSAQFPLLFLLLSVPIPEPLLSHIIRFLQNQSADAAEIFFRLASVPYLREDLIFRLPRVSIQVAEECSGIRSSVALFITTVLASYLFLRTNWKRLILCAVVVPLAIFKNGLRIATLSILAVYVNPGFLYGDLHHHGGIVFFLIALLPMAFLLKVLQKGDVPAPRTA
jgi:exosortase